MHSAGQAGSQEKVLIKREQYTAIPFKEALSIMGMGGGQKRDGVKLRCGRTW